MPVSAANCVMNSIVVVSANAEYDVSNCGYFHVLGYREPLHMNIIQGKWG